MRWVWIIALAVAVSAPHVRADDEIKPDQLKKAYDTALGQLKEAQDRKNQLAMENEKLQAKLAEMQKQLDTAKANETTFAERTYQLRATHAAWEAFLQRYPALFGQWQAYLQGSVLDNASLPDWADNNWTISAMGK